MSVRRICERLSVSPQITTAQIPALRKSGFRSIICARPDGEEGSQPSYASIARAAHQADMAVYYLPVSGTPTSRQVEEFDEVMRRLPHPVLVYCNSGNRATTLWSLSQARKRPVAEILRTTAMAGYNMMSIAPRLAAGG